ncbi:MAG: AAA family ATPase [Lysobacter sp.]
MKTVLVASSKGGVGKTTIATHLAAHAALVGMHTVLVDADPQGSATQWAQRRSVLESAVLPVDGSHRGKWQKQIPADTAQVFIDAPAGAMARELEAFLAIADAVVVPVQPSTFDIEASVPFLDSLAMHPRVRRGDLRVGLVGNRLRPWTSSSQQTVELLQRWPYPMIGQLRDSQAYVLLSGLGKSLFDYHSAHVREHQADWQPLLKWLKK